MVKPSRRVRSFCTARNASETFDPAMNCFLMQTNVTLYAAPPGPQTDVTPR